MNDKPRPGIGTIGWLDLTVPDAEAVRDFYGAVVGWSPEPVSMGEYDDYSMTIPDAGPIAGICHARGVNASMPPQWIAYFIVDDLDRSIRECTDRGGKIRVPPRGGAGEGRFCVIEDPAGAVAALYEPA
ncbi:MAG: VOC family protein [Candidatus Eisenbacteria bacterium]|nr:VOC family protein [Candidatus Latescibacterota bacterium]MBD3301418.1 VOC family protein [Candidatus Eisenbacteria bacterium]